MKDQIIQTSIICKEYSYTLKDINLNFSLEQNNLQKLTSFKKLLQVALKDVQKDIERLGQ